jgi:hypothetical protein
MLGCVICRLALLFSCLTDSKLSAAAAHRTTVRGMRHKHSKLPCNSLARSCFNESPYGWITP